MKIYNENVGENIHFLGKQNNTLISKFHVDNVFVICFFYNKTKTLQQQQAQTNYEIIQFLYKKNNTPKTKQNQTT